MSVIDTLIIDRTLADVTQRTVKGSYNASDLNRVTSAMDYLKDRFEACGYAVHPYEKIKIDRLYVDSDGTLLPDGYTKVEYIESSGTQYIDTGFIPNQDSRIVMDACVTIPEGYVSLFGSRDAAAKNGFCAFVASNGGIQSDYGSKQEVASESGVIITSDRCLFDKNKNVMTVNGDVAHTSDYETFSCSYPAYLLTINNGGSPRNDQIVVGKLYSCQIYNNDVLVMDFVPCINDSGEAGLYDLVNKQFYGNAGTGSFTGGVVRSGLPSGYTELEYIESSGEQYIDSGFVPNQDTRVYAECVLAIASSTQALFGCRVSSSADQYQFVTQGNYYRTDYDTVHASFASNDYGAEKFYVDKNKNVTDLNGDTTYTHSFAAFTCPGNMYIFATNNNGSVYGLATAKLYCMQIYDNGTLVRDFVPCINPSGEVGLYDFVNERFYGNAGSGNFIGGAQQGGLPTGYTELDYIESTGALPHGDQYIDTGVIPSTNDFSVVMKAAACVVSEENWFMTINHDKPVGDATFLQFGVRGNSTFATHLTYVDIDGTTPATTDVVDITFSVRGSTATQSGDATHTMTAAELQSGSYRNSTITIVNGNWRCYSCQIYLADTLVRDFVPCKNPGGEIGLYDKVNAQFYGNAGSGAFKAGPESGSESDPDSKPETEIVYDPYWWYDFDYPTPSQMNLYLSNLATLRGQFAQMTTTPAVTADMELLTYTEANDIEKILVAVDLLLTNIMTAWFYSGDLYSGEV